MGTAGTDTRGMRDRERSFRISASAVRPHVRAGNGMNFGHYPDTVVAVEPEDRLPAARKCRSARSLRTPTRCRLSTRASVPPSPPWCCARPPDARLSLAGPRRVLRPGGELRFFEHARSASPVIGAFQDLVTPAVSAGGGCHLNRDTAADMKAAGFAIQGFDLGRACTPRRRRDGQVPARGSLSLPGQPTATAASRCRRCRPRRAPGSAGLARRCSRTASGAGRRPTARVAACPMRWPRPRRADPGRG